MKNNKSEIVIVDQHPLFRSGLAAVLRSLKYFKRIFETDSLNESLLVLDNNTSQFIIIRIEPLFFNYDECIKRIITKYPKIKIITISSLNNIKLLNKIQDVGCMGFLVDTDNEIEIINAIESVRNNKKYITPSLFEILLKEKDEEIKRKKLISSLFSEQELVILNSICQSKTNKEIAEIIFRSHRTVEKYRQEILKKAKVKSPVGLLRFAIMNNLVGI